MQDYCIIVKLIRVIIDGLSSFTNARWLTIRTHDSAFIKIHVSVSPYKIRT